MIKSELIANLAANFTNIPERQVTQSINHILDLMSQHLIDGRRIEIRDFGSFCLHYRQPRNAHNPKTGEKVVTEPKYTPHFKPGKALRARVDKSKTAHPIQND